MTISDFLLMNVGGDGIGVIEATSSVAANPQLQFFENFPGKDFRANVVASNATLYVHGVNIPLSLSFNYPVVLISHFTGAGTTVDRTVSISFGLYSLNGSTLSLANSASVSTSGASNVSFISWLSMVTSATQNISPGAWYFAQNIRYSGASLLGPFINSSVNPLNAVPGGFLMGRMTASTTAMPASIATSELDITGSDAMRQYFMIITA